MDTRDEIEIARIHDRAEARGRRQAYQELFAKFDKYACIKDETWYKDFKAQKLKEVGAEE